MKAKSKMRQNIIKLKAIKWFISILKKNKSSNKQNKTLMNKIAFQKSIKIF